ncbi:MAG: UPF0179 family protein [Thermoplasmata archaeon]|nr:MAG: UPF0179 family protein [Thermoplasmata archaeon]
MVVSLVGETQAKVGTTFIFRGPLSECRDCKRKTVCFNLEEGTLYEIVSVRDKKHDCNVHEGGVRVVELKKAPIETTLDSKHAIEGSTVSLDKDECLNMGCDSYMMCFLMKPKGSKKFRVTKVKGDVSCPEGRSLKQVVLEM